MTFSCVLQELSGCSSSSSVNCEHSQSDNIIEVDENWQSENDLQSNMIAVREQTQSVFDDDRWKTFVAFLFLHFSFFVACLSLALTHDRLPNRKVYQPLPDVFLDNVANVDFLLNVTEIQIVVAVNVCVLLIFFHKYR